MKNSNYVVFCDFDGTITKKDTIDSFFEVYASDDWLLVEKLWKDKKINSKECLTRQLECINNFSEKYLYEFIDSIEIDDYFLDFIKIINDFNLAIYIISDGFRMFIKNVFKKYRINIHEIFSNDCYLKNGKIKALFPFNNKNCEVLAGMCKCNIIKDKSEDKKIIYIGDGRSDMCAAKHSNILFAKGELANYCINKKMDFINFENFRNIVDFFMEDRINVKNKFII